MPRVVHVITGLERGGAETVLHRLCIHCDNVEHVVISLTDEGTFGPLLSAAGVPVHTLGMLRGRASISGLWKLYRLIQRIRPDTVQTWMYHSDLLGGLSARLAGVRSVYWNIRNSNLDPDCTAMGTRLTARACAVASRLIPRRIVCCSRQSASVHTNLGYQAEKIQIIPNGYDLDHFRPDQAAGARLRNQFPRAENLPVLGMVARFDPQKDHRNLLQAWERLAKRGVNFIGILAGTGMTMENRVLRRWIADQSLQNRVFPFGLREDVFAVMNALDINILSSSYGEAFPNVLAEAMACGTPCVTTDVGDAGMIVGETGWVVPARNPEALTDALHAALKLREDHAAWAKRQEACRLRIAENFSMQRMVEAYSRLWRQDVAASQAGC